MKGGGSGATGMLFVLVLLGGGPVSERDPRDDDRDVQSCIQFLVRTKFLKSTMACLYVFLDEVTLSSMESFPCNAHRLRQQIFGGLWHLRFRCIKAYLFKDCLSVGWPRGLATDSKATTVFSEPAVLAV